MKLMIVFGTRPEAIKLAPVISEARLHKDKIQLLLCSTGQHREMLDQALSAFDISPDIELGIMRADQQLAELTARLIDALSDAISVNRPDAVVVQGDTTSAFTAALAAFYHQTPVAHVEAGLRTGNLDSPFPEELNRAMIGRIARWHFAPTQHAARNLVREGIDVTNVVVTGNTVVDAIAMARSACNDNAHVSAMSTYFPGQELVLVTTHRRESFGEGLRQIYHAVRILSARFPELGFVFPVHPNPFVRNVTFEELSGIGNLRLVEPVGFCDSLLLQSRSRLIITDSGGIQEEAPSFAVPTVVAREYTERREGVDAGFATLAGTRADDIVRAAEHYLRDTGLQRRLSERPNPYGDGRAGKRIIATLLGDTVAPYHG